MTRRGLRATDAAIPPEGSRRSPLWGARLPRAWYEQPVDAMARALLGMVVVRRSEAGIAAGRIVETEAYDGRDDPASHAFRGLRPHVRHLFGPPGTIYVYRSYGVHWCANVVSAPVGKGSAVLLRALEPLAGVPLMRTRRGVRDRDAALAAGPGNLCAALAITGAHDGARWWRGDLTLHEGVSVPDDALRITPRIGITKAALALRRFVVADSPFASRRR